MYTVYDLSQYPELDLDVSGARAKVWLSVNGVQWLFKESKNSKTHEYLVEKIACELARPLSLPHAEIELAVRDGKVGSASKSVLQTSIDGSSWYLREFKSLVKHGNSWGTSSDNMWYKKHGIPYNVSLISKTLIPISDTVLPYFIKAMIFDSLIANSDRHHSNWGILTSPLTGESIFSPLYDSGSGLYSTCEEKTVDKMLASGGNLKNYIFNESSMVKAGNVNHTNFKVLLKELRKEYPELFISFVQEVHQSWTDKFLIAVVYSVGDLATENRKRLMYEILRTSRDLLVKML